MSCVHHVLLTGVATVQLRLITCTLLRRLRLSSDPCCFGRNVTRPYEVVDLHTVWSASVHFSPTICFNTLKMGWASRVSLVVLRLILMAWGPQTPMARPQTHILGFLVFRMACVQLGCILRLVSIQFWYASAARHTGLGKKDSRDMPPRVSTRVACAEILDVHLIAHCLGHG